MMKGISMSVNVVIVIVLAVVVISVIGVFFISNSFRTASDLNNQQVFAQGCVRYCRADTYGTYVALYDALKTDSEFVQVCTNMGFIEKGSIALQKCLKQCTNCDIDVTQLDASQVGNTAIALTGRGS